MNTLVSLLLSLLSVCEAGNFKSLFTGSGRIYNGRTAVLGQIKYIGFIESQSGAQTYVCGGALVSAQHVLTAAHCVDMRRNVKVTLGTVNSWTKEGGTTILAAQVSVHPQYDNKRIVNDIAIIRLATNAPSTATVAPILLPASSQAGRNTYDDVYAVASGWGQTYTNQSGSNPLLQYSRLHVATRAYCESSLRSYYYNDGQICTDRQVNSGPCKGDSGGPLAYYGRSGAESPVLIGLTSWGVGPCANTNPVVYTYVGHYLRYISSVTGISIRN